MSESAAVAEVGFSRLVTHKICFQQSNTGVDHHKLVFKKATELMKSIVQSPVPVIAKVNF